MQNSLQVFLKLAANEDRFRMLVLLFQEDLCVCHMSGILKLSQPTVSKNLAKLRDTQFVETEQRGKYVYYSFCSQDQCVTSLLQNVVAHKKDYPQLEKDSKGLALKDQYLVSCHNNATSCQKVNT